MFNIVANKVGKKRKALKPFVSLPTLRWFFGDSQINGHGAGSLTVNNWIAFNTMYNTLSLGVTPDNRDFGQGGRGLLGHRTAHEGQWGATGALRTTPEWVHWVETGGQDEPGQTTLTDFGNTLESYMRWIASRSQNVIISTETQFSFGRESESGRDWWPHIQVLRDKAYILSLEGINLRIVENNAYILALQNRLGPSTVWYQAGHPSEFHFTDVGNVMTGLGMLYTFGHNVEAINFDSIIAQGYVTSAHITACLLSLEEV